MPLDSLGIVQSSNSQIKHQPMNEQALSNFLQ